MCILITKKLLKNAFFSIFKAHFHQNFQQQKIKIKKSKSTHRSNWCMVSAGSLNRQTSQNLALLVTATSWNCCTVPIGIPSSNEAGVVNSLKGWHRILCKAEIEKSLVPKRDAILRLCQVHRPSQSLALHWLELEGDCVVNETHDIPHCCTNRHRSRQKLK